MGRVIDRANLYLHARRVARREVALGRALVVHHFGPCGEQSPSLIGRLTVPFVYGPLPSARPTDLRDDEWLSWLRTPDAALLQTQLSRILAKGVRPPARYLWRKTINNADAITVEALANVVPEMHRNTIVIPPGIDEKQFSPSASDDAVAGRVVAVGRLLARKGYDLLIRAVGQVVPRYRLVHLILIGSGPEEANLRRLTNQLGIDSSITFLGNVPRSQVPGLLRSAEVYCHPARWDNVPFAPLEAMACGIPAIVSSAGGLPDTVGETGIVHATGDENAIARHLIELLTAPRLRRALGAAARARVVEHFTWQVMCDSYLELYRRLAEMKLKATSEADTRQNLVG
jgi:glycosyltransferase involved in cell wall biosynthesis